LIVLEDKDSLVFYRPEEIVSLTPFLWGWWRAVVLDGSVFHVPTRPDGPWVPLGDSWVLPDRMESIGNNLWRDAGGFTYRGELCARSSQAGVLEPTDAVWGIRQDGASWALLSDEGEQPGQQSLEGLLELYPDLIDAGAGLYLRHKRLRRLRHIGDKFEVFLDSGPLVATMYVARAEAFAVRLGLQRPDRLLPVVQGMREFQLRDYPLELYRTEAEQLKVWFSEENVLIANSILQVVRYLQSDPSVEYGHDHRGLWYNPVSTNLYRCGFIDADEIRWVEDAELRESKKAACLRFGRIITRLVGDLRLFTYRDLGFDDPGGRSIGSRQPHVLLLVEKNNLRGYARKLQAHFGMSYYISGGATKLLDVEFLAHDLLQLNIHEVDLYCLVDFDPEGTALAEGIIPQLERYGIRVRSGAKLMVHPSCFSEQELHLFALPCPMTSPSAITMTQRWIEKTGGIHGKPFGIGADHLIPIERVIRRMEELGASP